MRLMRGALATAAAITTATTIGFAQQRGAAPQAAAPPPVRVLVQITQVKPDHVGAYEDLIKRELIPAQKKGGLAFRFAYGNGPAGGNGFTYVSVQPIKNYAQFDDGPVARRAMGDAAYAAYQSKLRATMLGQQSFIQTLQPDLSIISGAATPSPLAQVQVWQIIPGKAEDFRRLMTTDYLPNYKKAGVKDFLVYTTNFGEVPQGQVVLVRGLTKYADLDGTGLFQRAGLTADAVTQINNRRNGIATGVSNVIERYIPELSFGTMPAPRPNSQ